MNYTDTTANTDSWQPINQRFLFEDYIQKLLEYAKSSKEHSEALDALGMSWEEYEYRIRALFVPKTYISSTASTASTGDDNAITNPPNRR